MKRILMIIVLALSSVAQAQNRFDFSLVGGVNMGQIDGDNADRYRPYQWDRVNRQYEALLREYVDNYRMYSIAEKQQAMAAIGRYHGILVDHGIKKGIGFLGSLGAYAGGLLDLLKQDVGAVSDFLQSVLGLKGNELNKWMDQLKKYAE